MALATQALLQLAIPEHGLEHTLAARGIVATMGRKGSCRAIALMEGFFYSLKNERVFHQDHGMQQEARQDLFDYIEGSITEAPPLRVRYRAGHSICGLALEVKTGSLMMAVGIRKTRPSSLRSPRSRGWQR